MKPPCPRCGWTGHPTRSVDLLGRRDGGYRADYPDAPTRRTRDEAEADMCDRQKARTEAAR